jgi:hypothetical protein
MFAASEFCTSTETIPSFEGGVVMNALTFEIAWLSIGHFVAGNCAAMFLPRVGRHTFERGRDVQPLLNADQASSPEKLAQRTELLWEWNAEALPLPKTLIHLILKETSKLKEAKFVVEQRKGKKYGAEHWIPSFPSSGELERRCRSDISFLSL